MEVIQTVLRVVKLESDKYGLIYILSNINFLNEA